MSRNNDVIKVLFLPDKVTKGADQSGFATASALANGDWGVFNYDTGANIWTAQATPFDADDISSNFVIAYRGDGTLGTAGELYTSSGTHIQKNNVKTWSINNDIAGVTQKIAVSAMGAESGASATNYNYGIKFDFRGNSELYQRFGANQASKFFMGNTQCVGTGTASDDADAEIAAQWAEALGNDNDQFMNISIAGTGITNTPVVYTASGTAGVAGAWSDDSGAVTEAVALAKIRLYATTSTDLAIVFEFQSFSSIYTFCNVNPKYFKQRAIKAIPALLGGDCAFATVAESQTMVYPEGLGYDVQELEYLAGGFTGKPGPYRQSRLNGLPFSDVEFIATAATSYTVCALEYDQMSIGGWQEYQNNLSTYIILQATPTDTAGYPKHIIDIIANGVGATIITT